MKNRLNSESFETNQLLSKIFILKHSQSKAIEICGIFKLQTSTVYIQIELLNTILLLNICTISLAFRFLLEMVIFLVVQATFYLEKH